MCHGLAWSHPTSLKASEFGAEMPLSPSLSEGKGGLTSSVISAKS